jgi:hypothetical protein
VARDRAVRRSAGGRSRRKYRALRRAWLRSTRKSFAVLAAIAVVIAVPVNLVALSSDRWLWIAGAVTGALLSLLIGARELVPGFVENWQQGAWGEEFTASVLTSLEREGWQVLHDLPDGRGNWDHIAVGPGGIFLLDSKKHHGKITVDHRSGVIWENPFDDKLTRNDSKQAAALKGQAARVNERIQRRCGKRVWVEPVMVLWADFPQRQVSANGVHFVHGSELVTWLGQQRPRKAPDVAAIVAALATTHHRA